MMRHVYLPLLTLFCFLLPSSDVLAASDSECAIILCAPLGFSSDGCHDAHNAMLDRIAHFKPAIPGLEECQQQTPTSGHQDIDNRIARNEPKVHPDYEIKKGSAVYVAPRRVCVAHYHTHSGGCSYYVDVKEAWIRDKTCQKHTPEDHSQPPFCSWNLTYQETWINHHPLGKLVFSDGHVSIESYADKSAIGRVMNRLDTLSSASVPSSTLPDRFSTMTPEEIDNAIATMTPEELAALSAPSASQAELAPLESATTQLAPSDVAEINAFTHDARVGMEEE